MAKILFKGDEFQAALILLHQTIVFKEGLKAPPEFYEQEYRSGIESMNFLFDVINEIAGYSEKYYSELANVVDDEDLI